MGLFIDGTRLNKDKYEVLRELGEGGFGTTYLAQNLKTEEKVVLKFLNVQKLVNKGQGVTFGERQEQFINEAITLAKFDHPHIVKMYEMIREPLDPYLQEATGEQWLYGMVMEYIEGRDLSRCLGEGEIFFEIEGLKIIEQIGSALSYLHSKNHLHRDVKPQNIMLRRSNRDAVLIDFGLARQLSFEESASLTGVLTTGFAPPEQIEHRERCWDPTQSNKKANFNPALDVYSLAATLYVLLAVRESPFTPLSLMHHQMNALHMQKANLFFPTPSELNPQISKQVSDGILLGMEFDLHKRPATIHQWLDILLEKKRIKPTKKQLQKSLFSKPKTLKTRKLKLDTQTKKILTLDQEEKNKKSENITNQKLFLPQKNDSLNLTKEDVISADTPKNRKQKIITFNKVSPSKILIVSFALIGLIWVKGKNNIPEDLDINASDLSSSETELTTTQSRDFKNTSSTTSIPDFETVSTNSSSDLEVEEVNQVDFSSSKETSIQNNDSEVDVQDKSLDSSIPIETQNADYYNSIGYQYGASKEYQKAIANFDKAIQLNPNYADAYNNRGHAYLSLEEFTKALSDFDKSVQLDPQNFEVYNKRGTANYLIKRYDAAINDFSKAIQLNSKYTYAYLNRASTYVAIEEMEKASKDFEIASQLDPNLITKIKSSGTMLSDP